MTKAQLAKLAAKLGATVVEGCGGGTYDCAVEAPAGHVWTSDGVHELVDGCNVGDAKWYAAVRDEMARRMAQGVEPCAARPKCEWCDGYGEDDDDVTAQMGDGDNYDEED